MKKVLKIIGIAAAICVVLLAMASVALHVLLPPEKAKALVVKQMTSQLKREVTLGDVSVGVLSGLSVSDLKVSEAPNFSKGTFLSSDQFSIRLALLPLLFRRVEVKQLVLTHPVIQIIRYADGKTFNFSDLMAATPVQKSAAALPSSESPFAIPSAYADPMPPSAAQSKEPSFVLLVSRAQIQNGVIHFMDHSPAKQSMDIDPLDLKLNNVSLTSPFTVQADLQVKARGVVAALKLVGEADLATESFKAKTCTLSSGGSTIDLSGKADHLKSGQPSVDLTLVVKQFTLSTLAPFAALPPALKLEGPIVANARVKGDQRKMNVSIQADLAKVQVIYGKQFHKPAGTPMALSFQGDLTGLQDMTIAELKATLGTLQLNAHGQVFAVSSAQPQVNLHLETNNFSVAELMGMTAVSLPSGVSVNGKAQLAADVSGTQKSSRIAVKFDGKDLEVASGNTFKKPADLPLKVSLVGEFVQQKLTIQNLTASLGSTEILGSGSLATNVQPPRFQLALKSQSIALTDLARLSPMAASYKPSGAAALDARASGTANAPVLNGTLTLQEGSIHYQQSDLTHITTTVTFTQQDVSIPKLTGKLNGADISLKMTGHRLQTQPDVTVEANITELDLSKLLPPAPTPTASNTLWGVEAAWAAPVQSALPPAKLTGHLIVGHITHEFYDAQNLDCKWNLNDVTPDLSRVGGTVDLKQGAGILKDVQKLAMSSKSVRVVLQPLIALQSIDKTGVLKSLGVPSLQRITFNGIIGTYALNAGVMTVKAFTLNGRDLNITTTGTIGLPEPQPLNLRSEMKLPASPVPLTLLITGTVANPHVVPDVKAAAQQILQNPNEFLNSPVGQNAQKLLKNIFK